MAAPPRKVGGLKCLLTTNPVTIWVCSPFNRCQLKIIEVPALVRRAGHERAVEWPCRQIPIDVKLSCSGWSCLLESKGLKADICSSCVL
jgi:hypothetical protein